MVRSRRTATVISNYAPSASGYKANQPGRIPTGPLFGCPKRPTTNRERALAFEQVREMANAHAFADSLHRPCNALLTIVWRHALQWSGSEQSWSDMQTRLLNQVTRWLQACNVETAFVWARERACGKGAHTHVAIYLGPNPVSICQKLESWLIEKFQFEAEGVDISFSKYGARSKKMRAGILRYIAKGIDHQMFKYEGFDTFNVADALGIEHRGTQGVIGIKRAGTSQNVGIGARRSASYREIRDIHGLARLLQPVNERVNY